MSPPAGGDRQPGIPPRWWAALALAAYTAVFFAPATLGGGQFFFRDVSQNHYPLRAFAEAADGLPLWNPDLTFGQPALANPNYLILHPITLLFRLLPFDAAFRWGIVLQFLLAAVGTYLLVRDLGCGRPAAWIAGIGFGFSGPVASLGNLCNVLATAAWLPLGAFCLRRALRATGGICGLAAALVLAVQVVGGEPIVILGSVALAVSLAWCGRPAGSGRASAWRLAWILAIGALLAAVQVLPTLELLPLSERGAGFDPGLATRWSTHPLRLLELFVPGLFGDPTGMTPGTWWGEGFFESTLPLLLGIHVGAPVTLLALAGALGSRRDPVARVLTVGAGLGVVLALGRHALLFGLLGRIPGLDSLRYPSKFLLLTAFCLACLAGIGTEALARRERLPRSLVIPGIVLAAGLAGGAAVALLAPGMASRALHGFLRVSGTAGGPRDAVALWGIAAGCLHGAVMAVLTLGIGALLVRRPSARPRPVLLLAALVAVDLYAANAGLNPTVEPTWYRAKPRFLATVREIEPQGRIYRFPRPAGFAVRIREGAAAASTGFLWDRLSLRNATGLQYDLRFAWDRNNERLNPVASGRIARDLPDLPLDRQVALWRLGSTRFVVAYAPLEHPGLRLVDAVRGESSHPLLLYEVLETLPRARLVGAWSGGPAGGPPADAGDPLPDESIAGTAAILEESEGFLRVRARAAADGFLVLSDTFFPGWTAAVDGRPAGIAPAYGLFRAVPVPAGDHEVTLRYRPLSFRAGLLLSAAGLLAGAAAALPGLRRRRRA
jgi:hypothetical protein